MADRVAAGPTGRKDVGTVDAEGEHILRGVRSANWHAVFVNFQHSSKAWEVGRFTVNLILSLRQCAPDAWGGPLAPNDGQSFTEGSYRISSLLGRDKDKWWHLKEDDPPIITEAWRPASCDDHQAVLAEASADATRDVRETLAKLGVDSVAARS